MTKQSGLGMSSIAVDDSSGTTPREIKNDVQSFQFATPRGVLDVTGTDKSAVERILLLADFNITLNTTAVNFAANPSFHGVFSTVPSTSVARTTTLTFAVQGGGTKTLACEVLYTDYSLNRGQDGSLGATAPGVLADGAVPTWA